MRMKHVPRGCGIKDELVLRASLVSAISAHDTHRDCCYPLQLVLVLLSFDRRAEF
jgi:hypothetical protein